MSPQEDLDKIFFVLHTDWLQLVWTTVVAGVFPTPAARGSNESILLLKTTWAIHTKNSFGFLREKTARTRPKWRGDWLTNSFHGICWQEKENRTAPGLFFTSTTLSINCVWKGKHIHLRSGKDRVNKVGNSLKDQCVGLNGIQLPTEASTLMETFRVFYSISAKRSPESHTLALQVNFSTHWNWWNVVKQQQVCRYPDVNPRRPVL